MFTWIRYNIKGDRWIWLIAIVLSIIGLLSVYSATSLLAFQNKGGNTEFYLLKHFMLIFFSFIAMLSRSGIIRICPISSAESPRMIR